ncbi:hypothetical protein [Rossellomorea vietnamensis]|uniref:hypothetical protein n=1 Tax=Rossellomorea vietnamensis TaxID=218284 RepID=UPI001E2D558F|nr:hypothetical protein [Rossellomorea vietnamensis]MCC5802248.1 hypothetical protein [Rossellomorea vietnamensis]
MKVKFIVTFDRFLEAKFYAADLDNRGATKPELDRDELLRQRETELFAALSLDTNTQGGSDQFDRLLELADAYRQNEGKYVELNEFVNGLLHS